MELGYLAVALVVIDLIATGIVGIIRKDIRAKGLFLGIFFSPLGLLGLALGKAFDPFGEKETGTAAVSAGIAAIGLGVAITTVTGTYLLDTNGLVPREVIDLFAVGGLLLVVLGVIAGTVLAAAAQERKKI